MLNIDWTPLFTYICAMANPIGLRTILVPIEFDLLIMGLFYYFNLTPAVWEISTNHTENALRVNLYLLGGGCSPVRHCLLLAKLFQYVFFYFIICVEKLQLLFQWTSHCGDRQFRAVRLRPPWLPGPSTVTWIQPHVPDIQQSRGCQSTLVHHWTSVEFAWLMMAIPNTVSHAKCFVFGRLQR